MNHLSDGDELEKSRKIILQRGFLYFGPGENNILRLTLGLTPLGWGEYFHLFNPMIGNNPNTYPAQIINSPDFFQRSHIVKNSEPLNSETYGKAILQSVYEGFYVNLISIFKIGRTPVTILGLPSLFFFDTSFWVLISSFQQSLHRGQCI